MARLRVVGRKKLGRVKFNLTMPPDVKTQAIAAADTEGRPVAWLVQEAIVAYLAKRHPPASPRPSKRKPQ